MWFRWPMEKDAKAEKLLQSSGGDGGICTRSSYRSRLPTALGFGVDLEGLSDRDFHRGYV